ncbi:hypothetical protein M8494_14955 [Serratia ureilytica]
MKKARCCSPSTIAPYRAARMAQAELVRARNQPPARSELAHRETDRHSGPSLRKSKRAGRPPRRRKATCWQRRPSSTWRSRISTYPRYRAD